jgi:dTDP-glucose pyrophosphorylase/CBS domain-containing protein
MKHLVLKDNSVFHDAVKLLDENGTGILPVLDKEKKLIGIITDGDIRRAILNNTYDLEKVINHNPKTIKYRSKTHSEIKSYLKAIHLRHMPLIDEEGRLVEVVTLDDSEFKLKDNWIVIMAGGLGSRLGELTKEIPKPMLEVGGKPILRAIVENFKSFGFHRFVFCVRYKSHIIEDYFGDGSDFGVEIRYTREKERMGTAGALTLIPFKMEKPFIVVNGDVLTVIDFIEFLDFHYKEKSIATMCVKKYQFQFPYATIEFDESNKLQALKEKPIHNYYVNTGMYILSPEAIKYIPNNSFYDMPSLFESLLENETTKVFRYDDYWLDIGRPEDYEKGNIDISV